MEQALGAVAARLRAARRIVVLTGAGISVASGIRTYRGAGGMWSDPALLAAHQADALPESLPIIWSVKGPLRAQVLATAPNAAHRAIVELQQYVEAKDGWLVVVTQNIDGLHERAGSTNVIELHGSVMRSRCTGPNCTEEPFHDDTVPAPGGPPLSCRCGRPLRPDVVLFGEAVPAYGMADLVVRDAEVLLVVGTSGLVQPAAGLVGLAAASCAYCVLVNAEPWDNQDPDIDAELIGPAEVVLPALVDAVRGKSGTEGRPGPSAAEIQHERLMAMLVSRPGPGAAAWPEETR
jgi:NAD-dependent deacetylase